MADDGVIVLEDFPVSGWPWGALSAAAEEGYPPAIAELQQRLNR